MNDSFAADVHPARPDDGRESIGAYLAGQRRLRGISLEELAERTRIPLRSLERLESGSFDANPDGFVRGFVRTVAGGLGLDPDDTLVRMLDEPEGAHTRRGRGAQPHILLALGVAVAAFAASVFALHALVGPAFRSQDDGPQTVLRRDPVRALAASHAASGAAEAPAAVASPPPAEATDPEP